MKEAAVKDRVKALCNTITEARARELVNYDPDTGALTWAKARPKCAVGAPAGYVWVSIRTGLKYRRVKLDGRSYAVHRLAWLLMEGRWPDDQIDHADGDGLNNRWSNLREATPSQNNANCRSRQSAYGRGVALHRPSGLYRARVHYQGREISLGYYRTPEEARRAFAKAKRQMYGEFAR